LIVRQTVEDTVSQCMLPVSSSGLYRSYFQVLKQYAACCEWRETTAHVACFGVFFAVCVYELTVAVQSCVPFRLA